MNIVDEIPTRCPNGLEVIHEASQRGLTLCFAGVGSAFAKKNDQTCLVIAKNGVTILVDAGTTIPKTLDDHGINITDFDYFHITHSHADHIGGLEELLLMSRYVKQTKPKFIITEIYQDILWEKSLKGGCEHNESGLLKFSDLMEPIRPHWSKMKPREIYEIEIEGIKLSIFRTIHVPGNVVHWEMAFWSTGLVIDDRILFSADTRFDPTLFVDLPARDMEAIFHDCQLFNPGVVHASYDELKAVDAGLRAKMHLTHYGDNFLQFDPVADGFAGFAKPWAIYQ